LGVDAAGQRTAMKPIGNNKWAQDDVNTLYNLLNNKNE
jgi:hypothetical protein